MMIECVVLVQQGRPARENVMHDRESKRLFKSSLHCHLRCYLYSATIVAHDM